MRYERLILEAGPSAVTVPFHPRLTVIAGVGQAERDQLIEELLGALAGGRQGVHLGLVDDKGRRLALIRPLDGPARVLEVDGGQDVTREFLGLDGSIDVLAKMDLTVGSAAALCRLDPESLAPGPTPEDRSLARLAEAPQDQLWTAAHDLVLASQRLAVLTDTAGTPAAVDATVPEPAVDPRAIDQIESRQRKLEKAEARGRRVQREVRLVRAGCALTVVPVTLAKPALAIPILGLATLVTVASLLLEGRQARAAAKLTKALAAVGAKTYTGFQMQRVHQLFLLHANPQGTAGEAQILDAADEHRRAEAAWRAVAGDLGADWALAHRDEVERLAAGHGAAPLDLSDTYNDGRERFDPTPPARTPKIDPAEFAHDLGSRFTALRSVGAIGESLPIILDDPLVDLEPGVKQWALELIGRSSGTPQVVFLTSDPEVAAWAQMEAMTGQLSLLELDEDGAPGPDAPTVDAASSSGAAGPSLYSRETIDH